MSDHVHIYSIGLVAVSVCAPKSLSGEAVAAMVNARNPTGINSQWRISSDPTFASGQPNPCPCNDEPEERQHWLLNC